MEYMSYYEEINKIQRADYEKIKKQMLESHTKNFQAITIRKIEFVNVAGYLSAENDLPRYYICMKNRNEDFIYIEKKGRLNNAVYKNCLNISKEECKKILAGEIEWMKDSSQLLLNDVYRQITINGMELGGMKDYFREVYQCSKDKRMVFDTRIQRIMGKEIQFFEDDGMRVDCLFENHVKLSYRRDKTIPRMIANMMQNQEQITGEFAFA